jgi:hypothetical protein
MVKLSNILCLANCELNKVKAECHMTLYTKATNQKLTHTFTKITERFDPWKEIHKLSLFSEEDGTIRIRCCDTFLEKRIPDPQAGKGEDSSLYAGVENGILKYIHGAPVRMFNLGFSLVSSPKRAFQITVLNKGFNRILCQVEVTEERLFKEVVPPNIVNRNYEAELRQCIFRRDAVQSLISRYIKKYLQVVIVGVDISE